MSKRLAPRNRSDPGTLTQRDYGDAPRVATGRKTLAMPLLICEDDALVALELGEEAARRAISGIVVARNALDAFDAIEKERFDAAVVDLHLEDGRSGPRIARRLAELGIRTVVLSGGELHCEELADAPHVFIRKPTPAEIVIDCAMSGSACASPHEKARLDRRARTAET